MCLALLLTSACTKRFQYKHDPTKVPAVLEDAIVNKKAVYGFSPNPESLRLGEYALYDWTTPEEVETYKQIRIEYHKSIESMMDILYKMRDEGATLEEIARAVSAERKSLRMEAYGNDPQAL